MADRYPDIPGAKGPDGTSQDAAEAIAAGDEVTCASVFGAPAYLSGLDDEMHKAFTWQWQERSNPLVAKRLRAVTAAKDYIDRTGPVMLKEWQKAVGVTEESQRDRNGRKIVTRRITPSEIRLKKTRADARFALPTN